MEVTVTSVAALEPALSLVEAREGFVGAVGAEYGAAKVYANELIEQFGTFWIEAAHDAPGASMDAFRAERAELYKGLKAAGHTNPSVKLKQVKDHARRIVAERAAQEAREAGEEPAPSEGEGSGKREVRSVQRRMVEELQDLYKFCKKQVLNEQQVNAFRSIGQALRDLGVNTDNLA